MGAANKARKENEGIQIEGIQIEGEQIEENVLKKKAKDIIDKKRNKIEKFMMKRYEIIKESEPNDEEGAYKDKPMIYKILPEENKDNLYIEIFNIPALLRKENGLFTIVNKIVIIFEYFSNKMKNISKDEYERKFSIFFKSILDYDVKKFNELIGTNIQEKDLYCLKQGLEKIISYFGIENTEKFFNKIYSAGLAGLAGIGTTILISSSISSLLSASGVGLAIAVVVGLLSYYILNKLNDNKRKMLENNKNIIEKFFDEIKGFDYHNFINCNIFVIVIDKKGNQLKDISLFPYLIGSLNSYGFPIIGLTENGESNIKYYEILLKGIEYYISYYNTKFGSMNFFNNDMINDLKRDINTLIKSDENDVIRQIREKGKEVCKNNKTKNTYDTNSTYSYKTQPNLMQNFDSLKTSSNINTETMNLKSKKSSIQNQRILADPC